ncbi:MAG TPA: metallophosphoesterase [Kofleriaceae bacterium]|nr:metallophosphoesterase [Kofleriaceae bacterium]
MSRRRSALAAALVAGGLCIGAPAAARGGEVQYVAPGGELDWLAVRVPLAHQQLGAIAAAEVDRAQATAAGRAAAAQASVFGAAEGPGEGWPGKPLAGASRGRAPLAARDTDGRCTSCGTDIGDQRLWRIAAVYGQVTFTAGDEAAGARVLELRVRYEDGMVAYLNGREVARRGIARSTAATAPVDRASGPEWETFYLPARGLLKKGENRLAVEVRPWRQERAPVLDVALSARGGGRIVRGPLVHWLGATAAAISFDTDLPSRATVEYAAGGAVGDKMTSARSAGGALAVHHRVELRDLPAAGQVRYRVVAGGDVTPELSFRTAPAAGDPVRFAVYGDMRGGHRTHARIVEAILDEAPDFVVVTGDMVLRGTDEAGWQKFFEVTGKLMARVPYFPAAGNHDIGRAGDEERRMNEIFALAAVPDRPEWGHWYSFDVAGVHVAVLDSNAYDHEAQLAWLDADLTAARKAGARALFAATHDGPYSRGNHGGNPVARERYAPLLARHGVLLLFAGHDHIYQRGEVDGLRYIVTGGGGASLYPIRCGDRGRSRCPEKDGAALAVSEHHSLTVTVQRDYAQVCPRRPDRTPLEKCIRYRLPRLKR